MRIDWATGNVTVDHGRPEREPSEYRRERPYRMSEAEAYDAYWDAPDEDDEYDPDMDDDFSDVEVEEDAP